MSALPVAAAQARAIPTTRPGPEAASDRRLDVDTKQTLIAGILEEQGADALLVLDQANLAWLTAGAVARNVLDPDHLPVLFYTPAQRWLVASNVESQRMFDEEMDELGFLLKEWPWHWRRDQLLSELTTGRTVISDMPFGSASVVGDRIAFLRRIMTPYEQACYRQLGQILAHAIEATCRQAEAGATEREIAGELSHRLIHRGVVPAAISVAADGRSRTYRRHGFTSAPVKQHCLVSATGRKYGLNASAGRSFSFGPPEEDFQREHLAACKVAATYIAATWPDAVPQEILNAGRRVFLISGYEHEWQAAPHGHITGRVPVEETLTPGSTELFRPGWTIVWWPTVGAAAVCDSFVVTDSGAQLLTPLEEWPRVGVKVSGAEFVCPYILER